MISVRSTPNAFDYTVVGENEKRDDDDQRRAVPMGNMTTERLRIREMNAEIDPPFILALLNEPGFVQFVGDKGVRTLEDARRYIEGHVADYRESRLALCTVELIDTGEQIGICGLFRREPARDVELGFGFLEKFWGKGYASESAAAVLEHGRRTLGLDRVIAITAPNNLGSINVIEKLGFRYESMMPLPGFDEKRKVFASNG